MYGRNKFIYIYIYIKLMESAYLWCFRAPLSSLLLVIQQLFVLPQPLVSLYVHELKLKWQHLALVLISPLFAQEPALQNTRVKKRSFSGFLFLVRTFKSSHTNKKLCFYLINLEDTKHFLCLLGVFFFWFLTYR